MGNGGTRRPRVKVEKVAAGGPRNMLVITRREGEEVVIGDPANPIGIVRIASIKGDRLRIAMDFPREIAVHRKEVASQIVESGPAIVGKIRPASTDG